MQSLNYEKFPDHDFEPNSLVVLLHGIGADAFDLIPLAKYWALTLPLLGRAHDGTQSVPLFESPLRSSLAV